MESPGRPSSRTRHESERSLLQIPKFGTGNPMGWARDFEGMATSESGENDLRDGLQPDTTEKNLFWRKTFRADGKTTSGDCLPS